MPGSELYANDDSGECYAVIKAGTVVGWFWMQPDEDQHDQRNYQNVRKRAVPDPVIVPVAIHNLENSKNGPNQCSDNAIEKAMHTTIETANDNGSSEEVEHALGCEVDPAILRLLSQQIYCIHYHRRSIG